MPTLFFVCTPQEWGWDKDDHATPGAAAPPLNPWQARLCGCGDDPPTYLSAGKGIFAHCLPFTFSIAVFKSANDALWALMTAPHLMRSLLARVWLNGVPLTSKRTYPTFSAFPPPSVLLRVPVHQRPRVERHCQQRRARARVRRLDLLPHHAAALVCVSRMIPWPLYGLRL